MISVVIAARNEAAVIGRLLDDLDSDSATNDLEVVVVANGCSDDTADVARRHGAVVVELLEGSKPAALRAGDDAANYFPRFYVDADIRIDACGLKELASKLQGEVLAVAPRLALDDTNSSWLVKSYDRIWVHLPNVVCSLAGRGCFGLTLEGRSRWEEWPDLVADDQYVNQRFTDSEICIDEAITSTVRAPSDIRSMVARKRRSHRGNAELGAGIEARVTSRTAWARVVLSRPIRLIDVPAYVTVTLLVRLLAAVDRRFGREGWSSDRSSRSG